MKWLKTLGLGILVWIIIFVEISITMTGLKLDNLLVYIIHYILLTPISILIAWLYYKSRDKVNGFLLGIALLIVGIILDMIVTVPMFVVPQGGSYYTYFTSLWMIIGFVEMVVVVGIYDLFRKKK